MDRAEPSRTKTLECTSESYTNHHNGCDQPQSSDLFSINHLIIPFVFRVSVWFWLPLYSLTRLHKREEKKKKKEKNLIG